MPEFKPLLFNDLCFLFALGERFRAYIASNRAVIAWRGVTGLVAMQE